MLRASTLAIALAVTVAACAGPAGDVAVLQSGDPGLAPGATVAWAPVAQDAMRNGDPRIDNDIIRQRIRTGVETALNAKGYRFVQDSNAAQYLVEYHIGLQERTDYRVETMGAYPGAVCGWRGCIAGYGWGMYGAPSDVRAVNYNEGTMIIDLTNRSTGQLSWRAQSHRRVDADDATQERITAAVVDMTKSLPGTSQ